MSNIFDLFKKIETAPKTPPEPVSFLLCGLGNPGQKYERTRHNAGFMALDALAAKYQVKVDRAKFHALVGEIVIGGKRGLLVKPQTFMNPSGDAVREAADFYHLTPDHIFVICDDINLNPGMIRLRKKGSDGGQKGLRSIIEQLGTEAFPRIRLGVGAKPHPDYDLADWVLGEILGEDKKAFDDAVSRLIAGIEKVIGGDFERAMSAVNGNGKPAEPKRTEENH